MTGTLHHNVSILVSRVFSKYITDAVARITVHDGSVGTRWKITEGMVTVARVTVVRVSVVIQQQHNIISSLYRAFFCFGISSQLRYERVRAAPVHLKKAERSVHWVSWKSR